VRRRGHPTGGMGRVFTKTLMNAGGYQCVAFTNPKMEGELTFLAKSGRVFHRRDGEKAPSVV